MISGVTSPLIAGYKFPMTNAAEGVNCLPFSLKLRRLEHKKMGSVLGK